jgi:hypothetical protein
MWKAIAPMLSTRPPRFLLPLETSGVGAARPKLDRLAWYYPPAGLNVKLSGEAPIEKCQKNQRHHDGCRWQTLLELLRNQVEEAAR